VSFSAAASGGSGSTSTGTTWECRRDADPRAGLFDDGELELEYQRLAAGTYAVVVHARNVGSTKSYETYKALSYGLAAP